MSTTTLIAWARDPGTTHPAAAVARVVAGAILLGFSLGKFVRHDAEAAAFDRYGIPFADIATYAVGLLEMAGGLGLVLGLLVRPFALLLAGNLAVAVATAGRIEGGPVHLGLAPALIATMLALAWWGGGPWSLDRRFQRGHGRNDPAPGASP
jgi:putative oxidoreductase